MENNLNKIKHQGTGWDHFIARDLHRKKLSEDINIEKKISSENKKESNVFSWVMDTINPLNHLPIVSSVKNFITKSNKSLDIIQSAVGGFLFAGPVGILKGIGGWAANKITNNFIPINSDKIEKDNGLSSNSNELEKQVNNNNFITNQITLNKKKPIITETHKTKLDSLNYTNFNINNFNILGKKNLSNQAFKNYSDAKSPKNKINISA